MTTDWSAIYRRRAEEVRFIAAMMHSENDRAQMRALARTYDMMAQEAEQVGEGGVFVTLESHAKSRQ